MEHLWSYTSLMATKHRRINVTCDPELAAALEETRELLGDRPDAARVRALALEGARALTADDPEAASRRRVRERLSRPDITPARSRDDSWLEEVVAGSDHAGTEALEWVRGPR